MAGQIICETGSIMCFLCGLSETVFVCAWSPVAPFLPPPYL